MIHICEYGCGQEAKYQLKNGKWCCSKSYNSCPVSKKKLSDYRKGKHHTERSKKKISESKIGEKNPIYRKHHTERSKKKIREKLRTRFREIKNLVKNRGYNLLSKEEDYVNQFSKLWFICPKGHEFEMRLDGFKYGQECPYCKHENDKQRMLNGGAAYARSFLKRISKPQLKLFNETKEIYPETTLEYPCLNYSIDIAIPHLRIAIEYDESYWHQDQEADDKRQKKIENEGWTFLRYRDYVPSKIELERDIFFKSQHILKKRFKNLKEI